MKIFEETTFFLKRKLPPFISSEFEHFLSSSNSKKFSNLSLWFYLKCNNNVESSFTEATIFNHYSIQTLPFLSFHSCHPQNAFIYQKWIFQTRFTKYIYIIQEKLLQYFRKCRKLIHTWNKRKLIIRIQFVLILSLNTKHKWNFSKVAIFTSV